MANINLDTNEVAFEVGRLLQDGKAFLTHPDPTIAHERAFENAVVALNVSRLVLSLLDPREINERDRFKGFSKEAREMINNFWSRFKVLPRAAAQENGSAPHIHHVGQNLAPPAVQAKPTPSSEVNRTNKLTKAQRQEIRDYFHSKPKVTANDIKEVAKIYGLHYTTVAYYADTKNK